MRNPLKFYLAAYNFIAFCCWAAFLAYYICHGLQFDPSNYCMLLLIIAQGLAVVEILHALLKWVKSPVGSAAAQVTSRLLVVAFICYYKGQWNLSFSIHEMPAMGEVGLKIISFAWAITELVRYSFYFFTIVNQPPKWLIWMRYSLFIVFYPAGVTGEWLIIASPFLYYGLRLKEYDLLITVLLVSYLYFFPKLYGYMRKQRKARLG